MLMLEHACTVARSQVVGTNGRREYATVATGVRCLFLPMSRQAAVSSGFEVGYAWDVYFADGTDIKVNDKLTFNGVSYIVAGHQPFTGLGVISYLQVSAKTENARG